MKLWLTADGVWPTCDPQYPYDIYFSGQFQDMRDDSEEVDMTRCVRRLNGVLARDSYSWRSDPCLYIGWTGGNRDPEIKFDRGDG
jgi:hypothetical protein